MNRLLAAGCVTLACLVVLNLAVFALQDTPHPLKMARQPGPRIRVHAPPLSQPASSRGCYAIDWNRHPDLVDNTPVALKSPAVQHLMQKAYGEGMAAARR